MKEEIPPGLLQRAFPASKQAVRSLFYLTPAPAPRMPVGIRAGLALGLPIAAFTLLGHTEIGLQASSGAFTVLYFAGLIPKERARALPPIGLMLLMCGWLGLLSSGSTVLTLVMMALTGILVSAFAYGLRIGPPGPVFFILSFGLAAHIGAQSDAAGKLTYVAAHAGGVLFAYLLAISPLLLKKHRQMKARTFKELYPGIIFGPVQKALFQRAAAVSVMGAMVGGAVAPGRTYWLIGAGMAVVGIASRRQFALNRALHRTLGTIGGALLFVAVSKLELTGLWLALALGLLQFVVELLVVRHYALALALITPLVLLLNGAITGHVGPEVVNERLLDTFLGAVIAVVAGLIFKPRPIATPAD